MDDSPEPTRIIRMMKEFNDFIDVKKPKIRQSFGPTTPRQKLNFSNDNSKEDSFNNLSYSKKRQFDDLTGLNIVKTIREKDTSLVESNATITKLESRIKNLDSSNKRIKLDYDSELESYRKKQLMDKELIDDLRHKINVLQNKEKEWNESKYLTLASKDLLIKELEQKTLQLQSHLNTLNTKYEEESVSLNDRLFNLEKELKEKHSQYELIEERNQELELQLATSKRRIRDSGQFQMNCEVITAQLEAAQARIKTLEIYEEQIEEYHRQELLTTEVKKNYELEKEVLKLRDDVKLYKDTVANTQLLEEQLKSAQLTNELLEKRVEHLNDVHSTCEDDKEKYTKLKGAILQELDLNENFSLSELRLKLNNLKTADANINSSLAELKSSMHTIEVNKNILEQQNKDYDAKIKQQKENIQNSSQLIKRFKRKLFLVSTERNSLKEILSSYESEATINPAMHGNDRVLVLEKQLDQYKAEIKNLEAELDEYQAVDDEDKVSTNKKNLEIIEALEAQVRQLESQVKKLQQENETLENKIEGSALKGDYNPAKTRILHFVDNPVAQISRNHEEEIAALQKEVATLKERIKLMEEGDNLNLTQRVGAAVEKNMPSSKQYQELQEKLHTQEIRTDRLLDAFKKKSLQMREIVYSVTGYRFDGHGEKAYKVTNMYADSPEDYLLFELKSNGSVELLDTEYANTIEDLIELHLKGESSYPALLSTITLDLFNRQTRMQDSSSEPEEQMEHGSDNDMSNSEAEEYPDNDEDVPDSEGEPSQRASSQRQYDDYEDMDEEAEEEMPEEEEEEDEDDDGDGNDDDNDNDGDLICLD